MAPASDGKRSRLEVADPPAGPRHKSLDDYRREYFAYHHTRLGEWIMEQEHAGSPQPSVMRQKGWEEGNELILMIGLTPLALLSVIGNLVLALRHPNNDGPSSKITRKVVAGMAETLIESGYDIPEEVLREWKKELAL